MKIIGGRVKFAGKNLDGFSRAELALLIGATAFSAAVSYLILSDYTLISGQFDAKGLPIAAVDQPTNVVKRRPAGLPVWNEVVSTEELYQFDQIYTDSDSTVRIRFNSEDEIEISENALVVIERYDEMASVNVKRGVVLATAKSDFPQLRIKVGNSSTILNQAGSQAIIESIDGEAKVSVTEGQADLRTNDRVMTIKQDREIRIIQDEAKVEIPEIKLSVPELGLETGDVNTHRRISWSKVDGVNRYLLEISKDPDFEDVVHRVETNNTFEIAPESLHGSYFVRAGSVTDNGIQYSVRKPVQFESLISPSIQWPAQGKEFRQTDSKFTTFLAWTEDDSFRNYEIELSTSSNFATTVINESVEASPIRTPNLAPGNYYFRVRGIAMTGRRTPWSRAHQFSVATAQIQPIEKMLTEDMSVVSDELAADDLNVGDASTPASASDQPLVVDQPVQQNNQSRKQEQASPPKVLPPAFIPNIVGPNTKSVVIGNADGSAGAVALNWRASRQATGYEVEIATGRRFREVVDRISTAESRASVNLSPGKYYWRVRAKKDNQLSPWSDTSRFRVRRPLPPPQIVAGEVDDVSMPADQPRIGLKWDEVKSADRYELEIASDRSFQKPVVQRESTSLAFAGKLPAGEYYSRVRGVEAEGTKGLWSEPIKFAVIEPNLLKPPTLKSPDPAKVFTFRKHLPRVRFVWDKQKFAKEYEIQVARDSTFKDLALNSSIEKTETSFPLRIGEYYWRVRAKRSKEVGPWTAMRKIHVEKNTLLPELTFPGKGAEIDFDETERRSLDVTWDNTGDLTNLVVLVSRDPNFTQTLGRLEVKGSSAKILIKEDGKYYWQVRGIDKREKIAVRSPHSSFTVSTTEISQPKYLENTFRVEGLYTPNRLDYSHKDANKDELKFDVNFKRSYQLALRGWFNDNWGFEMEFARKWADVVVDVQSEDVEAQRPFFDIVETGGAFKRRWTFWQSSFPIDLGLRFGYYYQPLFTFFNDGESGTYGLVSSDGHNLVAGFETRIPIGGAFNLETKFDYLQLITADPIAVSKSSHYLINSTLVGQFFRYLSMSVGGFYRYQSFSYEDPTHATEGSLEARFLGVLYGLGYVF